MAMNINPNIDKVVGELASMSDAEKRAVRDLLNEQLAKNVNGSTGSPLQVGWAKELIGVIGPEFGEPLQDFNEYLE